ncbi:ribonuclease P protein subunit p38-like [Antedon mediterranea]|uniref:ribonuclease P protein subunit p38-like n=1 Tax=Antedon mediterranea TaxID=105859 RepID=UPI003AF6F4FD
MIDDTQIVAVKSTLCTPYSTEWPLLSKGDTPEILNAFQRTFEPLKGQLGKVKSRIRKACKSETTITTGGDNVNKKDRGLRSQVFIGINEVTRALERGLLCCVVLCRSTKPNHMTNHLYALSATRETPALCLFKLSEVLAPLLNLKTVMAIGFKKTNGEDSVFDGLVELIIKKTPCLNLPWLQENKVNLENLKRSHPRNIAREQQDNSTNTKKSAEDLKDVEEPEKKKLKTEDNVDTQEVKRTLEQGSLSDTQQSKPSYSKSQYYVEVNIDKVKVLPKELKTKRRKKKKGNKSKS